MNYHLFAGDEYYPGGGACDYIMSSNAISRLLDYVPSQFFHSPWAHITDSEMTVVYQWDCGKWESTEIKKG